MPAFRTKNGKIINTASSPLGSGGEAEVYEVNNDPNMVAKIYTKATIHQGRLTELGRRTEQKLTAMVEKAPPTVDADGNVALAWPADILYYYGGANDGLVAGFTMPKIDMGQYKDILNYYNPLLRSRLNQSLARQNLRVPESGNDLETLLSVICRNIMTVLGNIHDLGYVIGDVNESNILVNYEGCVAFVDSDSFQVPDRRNGVVHRSPVGKEDFLSPRVIGLTRETCGQDRCPSGKSRGKHTKEFLCFDRKKEDDNFAIAVILFKLVMNGVHPLDNVGGSDNYKEKAANREFPYGSGPLSPPDISKNRWEELSTNWKNYFGFTFCTDKRYPAEDVLNLGHHLARMGGGNLGKQEKVTYQTNISGNGASASPAASQSQSPPPPNPGPNNATFGGARSTARRTRVNRFGTAQPSSPPPPSKVKCPKCDTDNDYLEIFCQKAGCQEPLVTTLATCTSCGESIPINAIYCPECGNEQYRGQNRNTILGKR